MTQSAVKNSQSENKLPGFKLGDIAYFKNSGTYPKLIVTRLWPTSVDVFWLDSRNMPQTVTMPLECLIKANDNETRI